MTAGQAKPKKPFMWTIDDIRFMYSKPAEKFFDKHVSVLDTFKIDVVKLLNDDHPEQVNYKRLHGKLKDFSRIAIGSYRIIYQIINGEVIIVSVAYAGSRGDIYKKFKG